MQIRKTEIDEKIKAAARREFLERGYAGASIQRIVAYAEVSVGNFYRYYTGKDDLFDAVVGSVSKFIPKFVADLAGTITVLDMPLEQFSSFMAKEMCRVFRRHKDELNILLHGAAGTEYSDFREVVEQLVCGIIVRRNFGERALGVHERMLANVAASGYMSGVVELLREEWTESEFNEAVRLLTLFFFKEFNTKQG